MNFTTYIALYYPHHNQDTEQSSTRLPCAIPFQSPLSYPSPLVTTDGFSITIVLAFRECHGIMQDVAFH